MLCLPLTKYYGQVQLSFWMTFGLYPHGLGVDKDEDDSDNGGDGMVEWIIVPLSILEGQLVL